MTRSSLLALFLAIGSLGAGCDPTQGGWDDLFDDTGWDTANPGFSGVPQISRLDYRCSPGSPDTWWFEAVIDGWAGDVTLDIFETGDGNWPGYPAAVWEESHPLTNTDYDPDGAWDVWELTLTRVDQAGAVISGRTTLWSCWWDDGESLAFMVTLYDDDNRAVECAIWGNEAEGYFNDYRGNDCLCFDPDGRCDD